VKIDLDLSGTVDVDAERARLSKDLATASKDRETAISKLENADFMAKAPEKVVATIKDRLATCDAEISRINERLSALAGS
jgi:valyl-tRNA synthetase